MSKLDRKTKRILQNLDMHTNSSVQHTKTVLDTESLLTIAGLSEPKTNVANSALESIDATTKSVLDKLQSPKKRKKTKKSQVLSLETKMALDSLKEKPAKSHSSGRVVIDAATKSVLDKLQSPKKRKKTKKSQETLTSETERMLSNIPQQSKKARKKKDDSLTVKTLTDLGNLIPLGYQNSIYKTIIYNIEVGVSYDDISKLMIDNDISWSDILNFTNNRLQNELYETQTMAATTTAEKVAAEAAAASAVGTPEHAVLAASATAAKTRADAATVKAAAAKTAFDANEQLKSDIPRTAAAAAAAAATFSAALAKWDSDKAIWKSAEMRYQATPPGNRDDYDAALLVYNAAVIVYNEAIAVYTASKQTNSAIADVSNKNAKYVKMPFLRVVSQLCMYTPANVLDALSCDNENVLAPKIIFVLMNRKTTINSSIYGACIKKVIPGSIPQQWHYTFVCNHLIELLKMSSLSNFQEIMTLFTERIPYLKEEHRDNIFNPKGTNSKGILNFLKPYIWDPANTSLYDLPGYLAAIRELRFKKDQLELIATPKTHNAFTMVLTFENGWDAQVQNQFKAFVGGSVVLGLMLVASNPVSAVGAAGAAVYLLWNDLDKIQTLEEYERYKMICECLYRSADERGIVPDSMSGYSCLNPKKIKKEVVDMNSILEEVQLEVEKLERWWQTAIRRPIDFEVEKGDGIELTSVNENGVDTAAIDDSAPTGVVSTAAAWVGWLTGTDTDKKNQKIAQIIERLEETMERLAILYFNIQYLDVRLRICSTYYNLEDCALDMKLVKDLMSQAVNYNNILKRFASMSKEKLLRSTKRKTRDTKIKRKENNTVAKAINLQTKAINLQTTALKDYQGKVASEFQHVEAAREKSATKSKVAAKKIHNVMNENIQACKNSTRNCIAIANEAARAAKIEGRVKPLNVEGDGKGIVEAFKSYIGLEESVPATFLESDK